LLFHNFQSYFASNSHQHLTNQAFNSSPHQHISTSSHQHIKQFANFAFY